MLLLSLKVFSKNFQGTHYFFFKSYSVHIKSRTQTKCSNSAYLAPRVGFEPTTLWLTVTCSTAELSGNIYKTVWFLTQVNLLYNETFTFASIFLKKFYFILKSFLSPESVRMVIGSLFSLILHSVMFVTKPFSTSHTPRFTEPLSLKVFRRT